MSGMLTLVTMTTTKFSLLILFSSSVVSSLSTWRRTQLSRQCPGNVALVIAVGRCPFAYLALVDDDLVSRGKAAALSAFYFLLHGLNLHCTFARQHCMTF